MSSGIESVLQENRVFPPSEAFVKQANISGMAAYKAMCAEAENDFEGFWAKHARAELLWHKPFTKTLDESNPPFFKWFQDGELNASYNCLDRHLATQPGKVAIIFEADDGTITRITYKELYHDVCRFANALKARGIKKGDRVLVYMPMSIQAVVAMQACARIGATHSVVFGGFSAKSIQERVVDAGAVAIIAADGQFRGGREIPLKKVVDEALALGGCEGIKTVFVYKRTGAAIPMQAGRDVWWHDAVANQPDTCEPTWVTAEHPLFILYTSGSTGKPKGVQHSTGGYLLQAILTMKWTFDYKPTDVFWCTADVGWVTGHTYIAYGPLAVRRDRDRVRGRADVSRCRPLLEDDPGPQGHGVLYGAHGDPLADQGRRRPAEEVRPVVAAHPWHRRRADQSGSMDVVLPDGRRIALPDRRHVVADGDRWPHDHAASGRDAVEARFVHVPAAGHHRGHRRRDRSHRRIRQGRHPGHQAPVARR